MIAVSSEPAEPGAVIAEIVEVEMKPAKTTKTPEQIATEVAWLKIKGLMRIFRSKANLMDLMVLAHFLLTMIGTEVDRNGNNKGQIKTISFSI